jgi:protein-tyrosine-phosphatase/DNA-binding transcriptional ArsR family regulator
MVNTSAQTISTAEVVQFFKVVADQTRLMIIRSLALTDLRAGEVVELLQLPQNAVSYHLKQLRSIGLLRNHRSNVDARDIYYSIDHERLHVLFAAAGETLRTGMPECVEHSDADRDVPPLRVLFLCTHNSARSQLAEAIARQRGGLKIEAYSAGSAPTALHPLTIELLEEMGVDPTLYQPKLLSRFADTPLDYIITVCDRVREACPTFPGDPAQIHWSFPDPTQATDRAEQRKAFLSIQRELNARISYLLCLPHPITGRRLTSRM